MAKGIVRVARYAGIVACCMLGFVTIVASGGGGGGGGDAGGGVPGFTFNQGNMVDAAATGAGMIEIFPGVGSVTLVVVAALAQEVPVTGDLGLCMTGSANLTWVDAGEPGLSTGDSASLVFTACSFDVDGGQLDGTANFAFGAEGVVMMNFDLQSQELVDGVLEREGFTGNLRIELSTEDGINFTVLYGGVDRSDVIVFTMNGQQVAQFGCFDVEQTFTFDFLNPETPLAYTLAPRGIANIGGKIMQLGSYWVPDQPLDFQTGLAPDPVPVSGTLQYLSFDGRSSANPVLGALSPCTAVGSPGQVDTDNSALFLTATGGGAVRLELYNNLDFNPPVLATVDTTWQALMD